MGCMSDRGTATVCPNCGFDEAGPPTVPFQLPLRSLLNDQYMVGRALGAGGFAITYLGWDMRLARRVAIKEYMPSGMASRSTDTSEVVPHGGPSREDFNYGLERFLEEARMVAQFEGHPGIIAVTNFFPAHGTAYLVMEYLEGTTLKDYLKDRGGRLAFDEALDIMTPVMDALREVHRVNVLHRDISPDNIYVTSGGLIKLLDFGAARQALRDRSQRLSVILKVGYAPEEQYRSTGKQGPWTDVYAVGATFYHLLTGSIPPPSIDRLAEDTIQLPSALGVDIPPAAEQALMTALSVRAAHRYPTIQDFQAAIGIPQGSQVVPPAPPPPPPKPVPGPGFLNSLPPWAKPAAGGAAIAFAFVVGFLIFHRKPERQYQPYTNNQDYAQNSASAAAQPSGQPASQPSTAPPSNPYANYNPANPWASITAAHSGEIAPLNDAWPLPDLDAMAQKALARAQQWAQDAQLVEIDVDLQQQQPTTPYPFYVTTPAGLIMVKFNFYSPIKQQAIMLTPNAPNNPGQTDCDFFSYGFVDWGSRLPLPAHFVSLGDAIKQAHLMGMQARMVRNATLEYNEQGTSQGGTDTSGLKWVIMPAFGDSVFAINAQLQQNSANNQ
jgi:serine/threonine protein kinase